MHGVFSGTYICRPFEPDVFAQPSSPTAASTSRAQQRDLAALDDRRRRARVEVEDHRQWRVEVVGRAPSARAAPSAAMLAAHTERGRLVEPAVADVAVVIAGPERVSIHSGRCFGQRFSKKPFLSTPFGNRFSVMHRPARCGSITGAMRA